MNNLRARKPESYTQHVVNFFLIGEFNDEKMLSQLKTDEGVAWVLANPMEAKQVFSKIHDCFVSRLLKTKE